jgi:hypothetical protein
MVASNSHFIEVFMAVAAGVLHAPVYIPQVDNRGQLFDYEVAQLKDICLKKDKEISSTKAILVLAALVVAVWVGIALSSFGLGAATFLVEIFGLVYFFSKSGGPPRYKDAANALETRSFKEYIQNNHFDLSIDSIVAVHNRYKAYLAAQLQG